MRTNIRHKLIPALFAKAANMGIDADVLRNEIAPSVIGKRISEATARDLMRLLDHITGLYKERLKKYKSSQDGLIEELLDAARERWGEDYEKPLRAFINSHGYKGTLTHFKFMKVAELKAFKERIKGLNRQDGRKMI